MQILKGQNIGITTVNNVSEYVYSCREIWADSGQGVSNQTLVQTKQSNHE